MKTKKIYQFRLVNVHIPLKSSLLLSVLFLSQFLQAQEWSLQQCLDTALTYNNQLQISKNQVSIAIEKQRELKSNLNPKIQLTADYKYFIDLPYQLMPMTTFGGPEGQFKETQFGVPHNINAFVQANMPLYNAPIYTGIKTTKLANNLAQLQEQKSKEQVLFETTNLYYNAQILYHQKTFIDSNLNNTQLLLNQMQLLSNQLLVKASDVNKVALQLAQLQTQRELVYTTYQLVLSNLKFSMGISSETNLQIETDIHFNLIETNQQGQSVDIPIAAMQQEITKSELQALNKSRLPVVSLYAAYGQNGFGYDEKPDDFLKFFPNSFAGVQISMPLFSGMVTKHKIDQKRIELKNNEIKLDLVQQQNELLLENYSNQKANAMRAISDIESQIKLAQTIYQHTMLQQREGTASLSDVLLADNSLREAQQAYLSAVVTFLKADLELKKANGTLLVTNK